MGVADLLSAVAVLRVGTTTQTQCSAAADKPPSVSRVRAARPEYNKKELFRLSSLFPAEAWDGRVFGDSLLRHFADASAVLGWMQK